MIESEKYMRISECRKILGCDIRTILRWVKTGKIKAIRVGRLFKVDREYFAEYLEEIGVKPLVK